VRFPSLIKGIDCMSWQQARLFATLGFLVLALLASAGAQARVQRIKPGQVPTLAADEGLLVVGVDSNMPLARVRLRKDGAIFGGGNLLDLPEGRSLHLYVLPAGRYEWSELHPFSFFKYTLGHEPEFEFTVEAGKINYPGDLQFRARTVHDSLFHISNRGLGVIDWLDKEHPALAARFELGYVGHYPDPFPGFYRQELARLGGGTGGSEAYVAPPKPRPLPLPVDKLWKDSRVLHARISPDGRLAAVEVRASEKRWDVELIDLEAETVSVLASSSTTFGALAWANSHTLLIPVQEPGFEEVHVAWIEGGVDGKREVTRGKLPRKAVVVDTLPQDPDHVLLATFGSRDDLLVHRVDISNEAVLKAYRYPVRERVNLGDIDDVLDWFTDGQGRLRLALAQRPDRNAPRQGEDEPEKKLVLMYGDAGVYWEILEIQDDEPFVPVGLSADGSVVYGITEQGRAQKELVELDPASGRITRTVFSKPGVDVANAIFSPVGDLVGATYYAGGLLVSDYFDAADSDRARMLQASFPGKTVRVADRSHDGSRMLLWVDASDQPAQLYLLDTAARRASLLDETQPHLQPDMLVPSRAFTFRASDGIALEAFITLPRRPGKAPLIVFPHGGPIGIADTLHYDPEVQFLASLGYAVLRVNYRGSGGYGKAFREAGHREYGAGIEDDIDAAIRHVVAAYPVDAERMCAVGSSYGGYSSLVMAIRWPGRFRCAVSIAGVSDQILFFTASDAGRNKASRREMERVVGNPHTELELMKAASPIYQYRELKLPLMIVHGAEDLRVDYEHARRLQRMLELDGRPPVGLVFPGEGHGVRKKDNIHAMWSGIAGFLQEHLEGAGPAVAGHDPAPREGP